LWIFEDDNEMGRQGRRSINALAVWKEVAEEAEMTQARQISLVMAWESSSTSELEKIVRE
jgi:hypothetical protein